MFWSNNRKGNIESYLQAVLDHDQTESLQNADELYSLYNYLPYHGPSIPWSKKERPWEMSTEPKFEYYTQDINACIQRFVQSGQID